MNIVEHAGESSRYMPRRGIAGSSRSAVPSFLRNCQTDFQSGCTSLQPHQQWKRVPLSPHPCHTTKQVKELNKAIQDLKMEVETIKKSQRETTQDIEDLGKKSGVIRCWQGYGERGTLLHCWWGFKLVQPLWKSVWQFLRKLGISLPEDPAIPLLGIYPEDSSACNKDTCSTMFIAVLLVVARAGKNPGVLQWRNGYKKCGISTQWITTQQLETAE